MGNAFSEPKELDIDDLHLSADKAVYHSQLADTHFNPVEIKLLFRLFSAFSKDEQEKSDEFTEEDDEAVNFKKEKQEHDLVPGDEQRRMNASQLMKLFLNQLFLCNCIDPALISLSSFKTIATNLDSARNSLFSPKIHSNEFKNERDLVHKKIFNSMDMDRDGMIDFLDFLKALSITCRGTKEERLNYSSTVFFHIFQRDEDCKIFQSDLLEIFSCTAKLFFPSEESLSSDKTTQNGDPQKFLEKINQFKTHEKKIKAIFGTKPSLSLTEFQGIAKDYPDIFTGFDFFGLFFKPIFFPIQRFLSDPQQSHYECSGFLQIGTRRNYVPNVFPLSYLRGISWRKEAYYFELKGGVIIQYKSEDKKIPLKQVSILGAIFKEICCDHKSQNYIFKLALSDTSVIYLKAPTYSSMISWTNALLMHTLEESKNRYNSYSPIRKNINAMWFINGQPFYERLADVLESAKEEIYITCWWISPEVYLRRRMDHPHPCDRFDYILQKKAQEGVMIYMILWNETKIAQAGLNSGYAKSVFSSLHENFKIICHPPMLPMEYAHHQKMIMVDQSIAFHGGVDVCWGRWDDVEHRITDPVHFNMTWPGKDYFNPTVKGTSDVINPSHDHIDRELWPRMSWHDLHMELDGEAARDVAKNFVERWNNSRRDMLLGEWNLANRYALQRKYPVLTWKSNAPQYCLTKFNHPDNDLFSTHIPSYNRPVRVALDEFLEENGLSDGTSPENPMFTCSPSPHSTHGTLKVPFTDPKKTKEELLAEKDPDFMDTHTCTVQNVRSLAGWSGGSHCYTEASLYSAYIDLINRAEHYVLIENQYFVSNTAGFRVQNMISEAILNRIRKAIIENRHFRVFIFIPIHPDGRYGRSASVRYIEYWALQTLSRGGTSMVETLQKEFPGVDYRDYISIVSCRTHDFLGKRPVTEQIYMHGKGMVVDDKWAIIGSANINDRSFLGYRDSEFATVVEDAKEIDTFMDGKPFKARRFALTMRLFYFREVLGLPFNDMSVLDPISDEVYHGIFLKIAEENSKIYREVFPYAPSNNITSFDKIVDKCVESTIIDKSDVKKLKDVKGYLVMIPLNLLLDGSLAPKLANYEATLLSDKIYT